MRIGYFLYIINIILIGKEVTMDFEWKRFIMAFFAMMGFFLVTVVIC